MLSYPNNLFCVVGQIIVFWSMIENSMHNCIAIIYHKFDIKTIKHCEEIPIQLSNKINCWTNLFKIPQLRLFKTDAEGLLKRIIDLKDERHNLTHGVFAGQYGDIIKFFKPFNRKTLEKNEYTYIETSLNHLREVEKRVQGLAKDLQDFSYQIQGQFGS